MVANMMSIMFPIMFPIPFTGQCRAEESVAILAAF
jgi:hypothetical protein